MLFETFLGRLKVKVTTEGQIVRNGTCPGHNFTFVHVV